MGGVTIIFVRNGFGKSNSNPGQGTLYALKKDMSPSFLQLWINSTALWS